MALKGQSCQESCGVCLGRKINAASLWSEVVGQQSENFDHSCNSILCTFSYNRLASQQI